MGNDSDTASPVQSNADLFCPECGYNLRGIASTQCPECGKVYERATLSASRIPWTNRQRIGWWRALLKTVWVATAHPKWIAESCQADLAAGSGRAFVLLCAIPVCAGLALLLLVARQNEPILRVIAQGKMPLGPIWTVDLLYPLHRGLSVWPVCVVVAAGLAVSLGMMPARVALFSRYAEGVRGRIVVGAHYLAGAWLGGAVAGVVIALLFAVLILASVKIERFRDACVEILGWTSAVFVPITVLLIWVNAWHVFRRRVGGMAGRRTFHTVLVAGPLLLLYLCVWLVLIPWCIGLLVLIGSTLLG